MLMRNIQGRDALEGRSHPRDLFKTESRSSISVLVPHLFKQTKNVWQAKGEGLSLKLKEEWVSLKVK